MNKVRQEGKPHLLGCGSELCNNHLSLIFFKGLTIAVTGRWIFKLLMFLIVNVVLFLALEI